MIPGSRLSIKSIADLETLQEYNFYFFSIDVSATPVAFLGMVLITSVRRLFLVYCVST